MHALHSNITKTGFLMHISQHSLLRRRRASCFAAACVHVKTDKEVTLCDCMCISEHVECPVSGCTCHCMTLDAVTAAVTYSDAVSAATPSVESWRCVMSTLTVSTVQRNCCHDRISARDRPKPISLVSAVAETVAETRDTYTAVTEP